MPVFDTLDLLQSYVESVTIPQIADIVEKETLEALNKEVEDKIYSNVFDSIENDDFYEHTFGLRDSAMVDKASGGNNRVGVTLLDFYLDPKSNYYAFYGGENVTDKIVKFLSDGHKGFYKGKAINYQGRNIFEGALNRLLKGSSLKKIITSNLKRLGYVIGRGE